MTLQVKKSITLEGISTINSQIAVTMMATISSESKGSTYVSQTVVDQELYSANRRAVRKDLQDFQGAVFDVEDEIEKGVENGTIKDKLEAETLKEREVETDKGEVVHLPEQEKPAVEKTIKKAEK